MSAEGCWESCFRTLSTELYRPYLEEIHKSGNAIKRIKDVNNATSISFLIDSNIAQYCLPEGRSRGENADKFMWSSRSSESSEFDDLNGENATAIFQLQLQLAFILGAISSSQTLSLTQFNENAAWSCLESTCVPGCILPSIIDAKSLTPLQTNSSSCRDGLLEPACRVSFVNQLGTPCLGVNKMSVAILNSNAHSHLHKHNSYRDYSPCHKFFDYRYAVGLHNANHHDLKKFQSREGDHNYLSDDVVMQVIVNKLYNCISTSCCSPAENPPTLTTCKVAYGDAGETINTVTSINPTLAKSIK